MPLDAPGGGTTLSSDALMRRRGARAPMRTLPLLVALLAFAPLVAATGHVQSQRYIAGPEVFQFTLNTLNLGGAQFVTPAGATRVTVTVADDVAGPGVGITVCQHAAGSDGSCGDEPGEPEKAGCSPVTLVLNGSRDPVGVWIGTATTAVSGCTLLPATRGNIVAEFE